MFVTHVRGVMDLGSINQFNSNLVARELDSR